MSPSILAPAHRPDEQSVWFERYCDLLTYTMAELGTLDHYWVKRTTGHDITVMEKLYDLQTTISQALKDRPDNFSGLLGDILLAVVDIAECQGFNLTATIVRKIVTNEQQI